MLSFPIKWYVLPLTHFPDKACLTLLFSFSTAHIYIKGSFCETQLSCYTKTDCINFSFVRCLCCICSNWNNINKWRKWSHDTFIYLKIKYCNKSTYGAPHKNLALAPCCQVTLLSFISTLVYYFAPDISLQYGLHIFLLSLLLPIKGRRLQ